jgi:tetratricopeptide (TPR) repeat protein
MIRRSRSDCVRIGAAIANVACTFFALCSLFAPVIYAQAGGFSADEHLTSFGAQSKTQQQMLADIANARKMFDSHPSAAANLSLGRALRVLGETEEASEFFDRALELDSKLAEAWFEKGLIISDRGDWSKATDCFHHAVAASPNYSPAHLALGEMALRMGDFESAANELTVTLRLDPNSAGAHQGLGLIALQEGKPDAAADEFRSALNIRPGDVDAEEGLARAFSAQHKWSDAVPLLKTLVAANPNSIEETTSLGTALSNIGDKAGAAEQFARARELSSKEMILLRAKGDSNWGVALRNEGKLQDAAAAFRRAIEDDPDYCDAHDDLGEVLWLQKDMAAALLEFQTAVRCNPQLAVAQNNLAIALLYYKHDVDAAIEQLRTALSTRPGFALAHLNLAKALAAKQDFADAEPEARSALSIDPALAAAHVVLGLVLASRSGSVTGEAETEMEKGLLLDPKLREIIPQQYLASLHLPQ